MSESNDRKPVVLLTGFGPFGHHQVNASWQAVKHLANTNIENDMGITLVTKELPVEYNYVQDKIPQLWGELNPDLTIHVGVHSTADKIHLEKCSTNHGYVSLDVAGCLPEDGTCVKNSCSSLTTKFDLESMASIINKHTRMTSATVSCDPGNYLCAFTYYKSLYVRNDRCIFVHVPPVSDQFPTEFTAFVLRMVIVEALAQQRSSKECLTMVN